ncbi:MAG: fructose-1,6-bisphosphatase [Candidatus Faecousia sp.]|nr:fructose-1,6-bisphosphatase [Clostridiales bacterium]MDD5883479.1 fructose-1,6-bisphosphatase [Bacillota bacterium]MDY4598349.1 fructose-1,6-bisphosphatase [Candidatus Faecousia sp.]
MDNKRIFTDEELHYLRLLARQYPTVEAAGTEIIRLQAILNLPKPTEHFMSDIHGEHEAFLHILNSGSGEVKEKLEELFGNTMTQKDRNDLATLIYYPSSKLALVADEEEDLDEWYRLTIHRLVDLCRFVSTKHTRAKVRTYMDPDYEQILDELIHLVEEGGSRRDQYENIISTIIQIGQAADVIRAICKVIKSLVVDKLHIVGDIFDRGPRADIVMDSLMGCNNVDIQWGNHDVLWMGAASGSRTLVATVLSNSIRYNNLDVIETGYGISLRPLSIFANEVYKDCNTDQFKVKLTGTDADQYTEKDKLLSARMYKAITIILFKLEGQKVLRRPEFGMEDRLLLDKINYEDKTITLNGKVYPMLDCDFPTVDPANPYELTAEENHVINQLTDSFENSEKLQRHIRFLYSKGGLYKVCNGNLLFHGCIPMNDDGSLMTFTIGGKERSGKRFLDYAEKTARKAYYDKRGSEERQFGMDFLWWLWAGRNSPIFGRDRMTTFERRFLADESTWVEPKNAYYTYYQDPAVCEALLKEFGLEGEHCHIINGHVPVKVRKGESPIKGGGKLIVIDGGFSRAYQSTSGIAGYTLIYNSRHYRIVSHQPFTSKWNAVHKNDDIRNDSEIFEKMETRMRIRDTDEGAELQDRVNMLMMLLDAYRSGAVTEDHKK